MKFFWLIVSISILSLSAIPCCTMDDCDNDDIATEQSAEGHEEPSPCSPFLSCGVCAGFIFTAHGFSFQPSPVERDKTITHSNTPFFENCLVKIWQPPKIDTALA